MSTHVKQQAKNAITREFMSMIWCAMRIATSVAGFLICNYLTLQGYVPSCSTLFGMVFSVFIISLSFRFFSKFILNFWGRSLCISIYLIIIFYAAIVISYGRIELNAYLIACFAKLLGLLGIGIIILGPTDTLINQMMPSGSEDSSNGSRGSGNWRDYILYPSPEQGEGADLNQLANPPIAAAVAGDQPQSPQGSGLTRFAGLLELPTPTSSEIAAIPSPLPSVEPEGQVVEQPALEQPAQGGEVMNQPVLPPVPQPIVPELPQPLLADEIRRNILYDRYLLLNFGGDPDLRRMVSILDAQVIVERSVEAALVNDGFTPESIVHRSSDLRGLIHSPHGELFSARTYDSYVTQIQEHGTRESVPYRRVLRAIESSNILLERQE